MSSFAGQTDFTGQGYIPGQAYKNSDFVLEQSYVYDFNLQQSQIAATGNTAGDYTISISGPEGLITAQFTTAGTESNADVGSLIRAALNAVPLVLSIASVGGSGANALLNFKRAGCAYVVSVSGSITTVTTPQSSAKEKMLAGIFAAWDTSDAGEENALRYLQASDTLANVAGATRRHVGTQSPKLASDPAHQAEGWDAGNAIPVRKVGYLILKVSDTAVTEPALGGAVNIKIDANFGQVTTEAVAANEVIASNAVFMSKFINTRFGRVVKVELRQ